MIKDLKELQTLLTLCRKQGITEITLGGTVIKFGDLPQKRKRKKKAEEEIEGESEETPTDEPTDAQLMNFNAIASVGGFLP